MLGLTYRNFNVFKFQGCNANGRISVYKTCKNAMKMKRNEVYGSTYYNTERSKQSNINCQTSPIYFLYKIYSSAF